MRRILFSGLAAGLLLAIGVFTVWSSRTRAESRVPIDQAPVLEKYQDDAMEQIRAEQEENEARKWREDTGTRLRAQDGVDGEILTLQNAFVERFNALAPVPDDRTAYFQWLDHVEFNMPDREWTYRIRGWYGQILGMEPAGPDAMTVRLQLRPDLVSNAGNITQTPDYAIEIYAFSPTTGEIRYLRPDEPGPGETRSHGGVFGD